MIEEVGTPTIGSPNRKEDEINEKMLKGLQEQVKLNKGNVSTQMAYVLLAQQIKQRDASDKPTVERDLERERVKPAKSQFIKLSTELDNKMDLLLPTKNKDTKEISVDSKSPKSQNSQKSGFRHSMVVKGSVEASN